jgi:hypothetical protein
MKEREETIGWDTRMSIATCRWGCTNADDVDTTQQRVATTVLEIRRNRVFIFSVEMSLVELRTFVTYQSTSRLS